MKKLDDNTYRDELKSVKVDFDKTGLWDAIENQVDNDSRKNKVVLWWILGIILVSSAVLCNYLSATLPKASTSTMATTTPAKSSDNISSSSQVSTVTQVKANASNTAGRSSASVLQSNTLESNPSTRVNTSRESAPRDVVQIKSQLQLSIQQTTSTTSSEYDAATEYITLLTPAQHLYYSIGPPRSNQKEVGSILNRFNLSESVTSISPEQNPNPKTHELSISLFGGIPRSINSASDLANQSWVDQSKDAYTQLYSLGLDVIYGSSISQQFTVLGGVHIDRVTERLNTTINEVNIELIPSDSAQYIVNSLGNNQYFSGERTKTTNRATTIQHYNHAYTIGVSLGGRYQFKVNDRQMVFVEGLFKYNPIHMVNGRFIDQAGMVGTLASHVSTQPIQLGMKTGLQCQLSSKWSYRIGLQLETDLNNRLDTPNLSVMKQRLGLSVGLAYSL